MSKVYIIGGMAMDVEGRSYEKLVRSDSNPGVVHTSHGGVGRNITENLAHLGVDVGLVSVIGNDDSGRMLTRKLLSLGVDVDNVVILTGEKTAMYLSLLDADGTLKDAIASMDILSKIDVSMLRPLLPRLLTADIVGLDTNLSPETLEFLGSELAPHVTTFVDAVSAPKAAKLRGGLVGKFAIIKANRAEAEAITGIDTSTEDGIKAAAEGIIAAGSKNVVITMDSDGAYFKSAGGSEGFVAVAPVSKVVSITGAGDAFSAMSLYGYMQKWPPEKTMRYATAMSSIVVQSPVPVPDDLTLEKVRSVAEYAQW